MTVDTLHVDELRLLEAEAVHIIREVVAELERPVLLFSAGKDSIVLLRLAEKAFRPSPLPFPVMHVDTGHNFDEVIEFRDRRVTGARPQADRRLRTGVDRQRPGSRSGPRRVPQPAADPHAAGCPGSGRLRRRVRRRAPRRGARPRQGAHPELPRRVRSVGSAGATARAVVAVQRPDQEGEQVRVFPLSNWTELDVWRYIELESLELPSIYFAHEREVFERDGILLAVSEYAGPADGETGIVEWVRYRTVGDLTITGAVRSKPPTSSG